MDDTIPVVDFVPVPVPVSVSLLSDDLLTRKVIHLKLNPLSRTLFIYRSDDLQFICHSHVINCHSGPYRKGSFHCIDYIDKSFNCLRNYISVPIDNKDVTFISITDHYSSLRYFIVIKNRTLKRVFKTEENLTEYLKKSIEMSFSDYEGVLYDIRERTEIISKLNHKYE